VVDAASAISDQNAKDQNANEFIAEGADLFRQNPDQAFEFDSIESALADLAAGRAIVVVDDEDRENEGDVICAAQFATPDMINFMAVEA